MPSKVRQAPALGAFPLSDWASSPLLQLRTIYAAFVQGLFAVAPPGTYRWSADPESTEIMIVDEGPIHVQVVGKRPAITFSRGPIHSNPTGQNDLVSYDMSTGRRVKSILLSGYMTINCCSRVDIESEQLAFFVSEQLWMHKELLAERAGFHEIGRFVVGSPSPAGSIVAGDGGDEWYATPISSPFAVHRTSAFTPLGAEILQSINTQLTLRGFAAKDPPPAVGVDLDVRPRHVPLKPPSLRGRTIPFP